MQKQTRQNLQIRHIFYFSYLRVIIVAFLIIKTSGAPTRGTSKGRWQLAPNCPVMLETRLEIPHNQSEGKGNTTVTIVTMEYSQQLPDDYLVPQLQQPMESVHVDDTHSAVFGILRAKENEVTNEIDIVIESPPEIDPDLSCKQSSICMASYICSIEL